MLLYVALARHDIVHDLVARVVVRKGIEPNTRARALKGYMKTRGRVRVSRQIECVARLPRSARQEVRRHILRETRGLAHLRKKEAARSEIAPKRQSAKLWGGFGILNSTSRRGWRLSAAATRQSCRTRRPFPSLPRPSQPGQRSRPSGPSTRRKRDRWDRTTGRTPLCRARRPG